MIRFLLIALVVVALIIVVGNYLNGPSSVYDSECSDPTPRRISTPASIAPPDEHVGEDLQGRSLVT